jgi:hypothetical protein
MGVNGNGLSHPPGNGISPRPTAASSSTPRCPRRLVVLAGDEDSAAEQVVQEYHGAEVSGKRLHADLRRCADEHPGKCVAAEWLGSLGWTRFLWCRR